MDGLDAEHGSEGAYECIENPPVLRNQKRADLQLGESDGDLLDCRRRRADHELPLSC